MKYWIEEKNKWLIENTKGLSPAAAYSLWCEHWPNENKTMTSISNQRSRLKCASCVVKNPHSTKIKPLYTERLRRGYWQIKVAMPSVWWSKAKWIWINTHIELIDTLLDTDNFYFADGDINNFNPDNILLVHKRETSLFQLEGGIIPGNPELSRIHLLLARSKLAILDAAEKCGDVEKIGDRRVIRQDFNAKARSYYRKRYAESEEYRQKIKVWHKNHKARMTEEQKEHRKKYQREWKQKQEDKAK